MCVEKQANEHLSTTAVHTTIILLLLLLHAKLHAEVAVLTLDQVTENNYSWVRAFLRVSNGSYFSISVMLWVCGTRVCVCVSMWWALATNNEQTGVHRNYYVRFCFCANKSTKSALGMKNAFLAHTKHHTLSLLSLSHINTHTYTHHYHLALKMFESKALQRLPFPLLFSAYNVFAAHELFHLGNR